MQLVKEEMRRVLAFLEWRASWWDRQGKAQLNVSDDILEGARAYAAKQAHINRALAASFEACWGAELRQDQDKSMGHDQELGDASTGSSKEMGSDTRM